MKKVEMNDDAGSEAAVADEDIQSVSLCVDVEPWPKPVSGISVLADLVGAIRRYLIVSYEAAVAIALWIMFTHAEQAFRILPILALLSPTRGCGKTTMLTLLSWTVLRPLPTANMTPAVLFRAVDAESPTVLIDEGDTFLGKRSGLIGLLNAGHNRTTAKVYRCGKGQTQGFNVASPKAIAAIGTLPDTIMQRSIVIEMRRKSARDLVDDIYADEEAIKKLGRKAARWARDNDDRLRTANPKMPDSLINRTQDNWKPLLAIAECAGGKWAKEARQAALALTKGMDPCEGAIGEMLLTDLKPLVGKFAGKSVIPSKAIVALLVAMEHRPWPEINGHALTAPKLARLLKPFGIQPGVHRDGKAVVRGYKPAQFADAFARYAN